MPIPRDKPDIAGPHALAAQYLGMKLVYLEAGSGAKYAVPSAMITAVKARISIPDACRWRYPHAGTRREEGYRWSGFHRHRQCA